ncbi:protein tweety 2 [Biomphalaria glabrata]|uniref:Protein tweety homolog n=1 Tax=Biomphalaria glabrata TaxID=6526 RepID=A0A2C9KNG6_BIOGL|nr:protein tweety 2 [Biomphalaria glabrata]
MSVTEMATDIPSSYSVEWLSTFFHGFPHVDLSFNKFNNVAFQPDNKVYRQMILFWALVPVAACCFLCLLFLFYFIIRCCCCRSERQKRRPSICARVTSGLLIFLGAGLIGFGLYENENIQHGIDTARNAAIDASNIVTSALFRITVLGQIANDVQNVSTELENAVKKIGDQNVTEVGIELIDQIRYDSIVAQNICNAIIVDDHQKEIKYATDLTNEIEYYRWVITIVIYSVYLFICFLTTVGLLLKSRATLIVSAVVSVICSILLWVSAGAYLGSSVALGDLCVDPDSYALSLVDPPNKWIATAYLKCSDSSQPYQKQIVEAQTTLIKASSIVDDVQKLAEPFHIEDIDAPLARMKDDLNYATGNLSTLLNTVGMCTNLHQLYITGLEAVCNDTINSTALLALVCCVLGVIFTIIIFAISCIWRGYIHKRRTDYTHADDTDPFLPRPPPYESDYGAISQSSPRPWSERGSLQHSASASGFDDQYLMTTNPHTFPDESPPPAYYPGGYGRRITGRATTNY